MHMQLWSAALLIADVVKVFNPQSLQARAILDLAIIVIAVMVVIFAGGGGNSPYMYRKNGDNFGGGGCSWPPTSSNHFGVDNNSNFPFHWGCCNADAA